MPDYTRRARRFTYQGVSLFPQDLLPEGKVAFAQNIRSYQEGTVGPRVGLTLQSTAPLGAPIHSIFRLNDTTPFGGGNPERRIIGAGTSVFAGSPGVSAYGNINGALVFSGNPLTAVVAAPFDSPRPYIYIGDSSVMRKVNSDLQDSTIGQPTPTAPPTALYGAIQVTKADDMGGATPGTWNVYGAAIAPANIVLRIATSAVVSITNIIYDSGVNGFASISLDNMTGIIRGCTADFGVAPGTVEKVIVQEVYPPIASTTIAAIQYDVGTNGLCTIQPTGSLFSGQIEAPDPNEYRRRYELGGSGGNVPAAPHVTVTRTIDYPVDALIQLNAAEVVRILSVAIGDNGEMSFRCSTLGTFSAGQSITGIASFRAYTVNTWTVGTSVIGYARSTTILANASTPVVGGIQESPLAGNYPWGKVGTQATRPEDIIRFGFRCDQFGLVQSVRMMLNVDPATVTFLQNYYVYEWRAADLATAIQSAAGTGTGLMADAQGAAVTQGQVDAQYGDQYGQGFVRYVFPRPSAAPAGTGGPQPIARGTGGLRGLTERALRGTVAMGGTQSRQLTIGDQQWMWLECRVGDLTRVGTDVTRTIDNINGIALAVQIASSAATPTVTIEFGDMYLTGGYGPDTGPTLPPYVYRYRYRRTSTGERGNPSPPMRAGMKPQRGLVNLTGATPGASDAVTDWFRYGGALARWAYVGTSPAGQNPPVLADDRADVQIDGGETLRTDLFQPWPTYDIPRSGTGDVAGTSFTRTGGDNFDPNWAADSLIIINGRATTLYRQPGSTSRLDVVDNIGAASGVTWTMPSPTLLGQPLAALWGGPIDGVWFNFACADPSDPGLLHWTHGNDPDATSDRNTLVVTSASEPLQMGFFEDGVPYVFSTDKLYRIVPTFGQISDFRAVETACTKGLWSRWFMCITPDGTYFGNKSGIYFTSGGAEAISITDDDLKPLFPQDGFTPEAIRSFNPIDFTQTTRLKLSYVDSMVYFDYVDTAGEDHTWVYEPSVKRWTPDTYPKSGVRSRIGEPGRGVHTNLIGCADGNLYIFDETKLTDDGTDIPWAVWTPWENGDDPRADKQWGDAVLDLHPGDSFAGITVTPVIDNGNTALASSVVGIGGLVRTTALIEVFGGDGILSRNLGLLIQGATNLCDGNRPLLYLWEPSFLNKQVRVARRATDWEDLGYKGAKFIQGIVLRANTYNVAKQLEVQYDGGTVALTFDATHDGERSIAYPLAAAGWTPFVAELVRLQGGDDDAWTLLDYRWVWEPAPEAATQWETQDTTFDLPGFLAVADAVIAYQASALVTLRVFHDANFVDYTLPSTGGIYQRYFQRFQAKKGKSAKFRLTSTAPVRLFKRDCSVRVQGWGQPGGMQVVNPFGGPHRADGAAI